MSDSPSNSKSTTGTISSFAKLLPAGYRSTPSSSASSSSSSCYPAYHPHPVHAGPPSILTTCSLFDAPLLRSSVLSDWSPADESPSLSSGFSGLHISSNSNSFGANHKGLDFPSGCIGGHPGFQQPMQTTPSKELFVTAVVREANEEEGKCNLSEEQWDCVTRFRTPSLVPSLIEPFYSFVATPNSSATSLIAPLNQTNSYDPSLPQQHHALLSAIIHVLNSHTPSSTSDYVVDFSIRSSRKKLVGIVYHQHTASIFHLHLFSPSNGNSHQYAGVDGNGRDEGYIVEFQRRCGDAAIFCGFYGQFLKELEEYAKIVQIYRRGEGHGRLSGGHFNLTHCPSIPSSSPLTPKAHLSNSHASTTPADAHSIVTPSHPHTTFASPIPSHSSSSSTSSSSSASSSSSVRSQSRHHHTLSMERYLVNDPVSQQKSYIETMDRLFLMCMTLEVNDKQREAVKLLCDLFDPILFLPVYSPLISSDLSPSSSSLPPSAHSPANVARVRSFDGHVAVKSLVAREECIQQRTLHSAPASSSSLPNHSVSSSLEAASSISVVTVLVHLLTTTKDCDIIRLTATLLSYLALHEELKSKLKVTELKKALDETRKFAEKVGKCQNKKVEKHEEGAVDDVDEEDEEDQDQEYRFREKKRRLQTAWELLK